MKIQLRGIHAIGHSRRTFFACAFDHSFFFFRGGMQSSDDIKVLKDKIAEKEKQIGVTTDLGERKLMRQELVIMRQQELLLIEREEHEKILRCMDLDMNCRPCQVASFCLCLPLASVTSNCHPN